VNATPTRGEGIQGQVVALAGAATLVVALDVDREALEDSVAALRDRRDLIAWIVSPQASFTTGFTFDLSGGRATY
jgi:hypothetical protein